MIEHYYSSRSTTFSSLLFSALRVGSNVVISFSPSIREASCVVSGAPSSKLPDWNNRKETGEKKIIIKIEWGLQQWNRWAYSFKASVSGCCVCERLWILSSTKVRDITRSSRSPQERVTHRLSVINTDVFFFLPISSFDQLAPRWLVAISTPMCLSLFRRAVFFLDLMKEASSHTDHVQPLTLQERERRVPLFWCLTWTGGLSLFLIRTFLSFLSFCVLLFFFRIHSIQLLLLAAYFYRHFNMIGRNGVESNEFDRKNRLRKQLEQL